jgi:membrane protein, antimicrobial resistance system
MFQNLIDIITAPSTAFARIKEKPTIWFPLLLILLMTASVQLGYFLINDPGFVRDNLVEQATATNPDMPQEQKDAIAANYEKININTIAISATVAVFVLIPIILALNALYLSFMAKFSFTQLGWKHWFSLVCWTGVPALFAALASWVVLLTDSNGQIEQAALQPLSVTNLFGIETSNPTLQQFNLMQVWSMALLVLGYHQWTGKNLLTSALITLLPYVVIYGAIMLFTS